MPSTMIAQYKSCALATTTTLKPNWLSVTCFQFVYSMVNTGMGLFVLPMEAERLNVGSGSVWLGIYLTLCGLTQAIGPVIGKISDRHASKYGRRRPFIVAGTVAAVIAFAIMRYASLMSCPKLYIACLFIGETAVNIAFAAQCGLPADIQGAVMICQLRPHASSRGSGVRQVPHGDGPELSG